MGWNTSYVRKIFKSATNLRRELPTNTEIESIPLMELSHLAEDIHAKTRKASQNTDLDMQEFLGIDKTLPTIQGELVNNTSKLTGINERIEKRVKS